MASNLLHNEQLKLFAAFFSDLGVAAFAAVREELGML